MKTFFLHLFRNSGRTLSQWLAAVLMGLIPVIAPAEIAVYNQGVPGDNTAGGVARVKNIVPLKPAYVLIYFGMNDAVNEAKFVAPGPFEKNLQTLIASVREQGAVPVLSTVHHCVEKKVLARHPAAAYGTEGPNGKIDRYNAIIRAVASREGAGLADFAKVTGGLPEADWMGDDGVHLSVAGYKKLAETFFGELRGKVKDNSAVVCLGDSLTAGVGVSGKGRVEGDTYPAVLKKLLN